MDRVLALSNRLREGGIDCQIDQYERAPVNGWAQWCTDQVKEAQFVLVACTETYLRRFEGKEKAGTGLGGTWEGHIIMQELYNAQGKNSKFIPIIFSQQDTSYVPVILQGATHYELSDPTGYEPLYRHLTNQPLIERPPLGGVKPMPSRKVLPPQPKLERKAHEMYGRVHSIYQPLYDDLGVLENSMKSLGVIYENASMMATITPDEIHYVELAAEPVGKARTRISQFGDTDTRRQLDEICQAVNMMIVAGPPTAGIGARLISGAMVKYVTELREKLGKLGCK